MSSNDKPEHLDIYTEQPLISVISGTLYAFLVVVVSSFLLFLNALVCLAAYSAIPKFMGDEQDRVGQMFFFLVPPLMLIVEWHVYDRVRRLFFSEA